MKQQDIMNEAYARWQNNDWSQEQFWNQLSYVEKVAVFTGNLNYQVENGGFAQWIDNGYSDCADDLIDILSKLGTSTCLIVAGMIKNAMERKENANYECFYCLHGCECPPEIYEDQDDNEYEDYVCWCECECTYAEYDDLDTGFYKINDQFLADVQEWLNEQGE